jgi:hypothetical protein
MEKYQNRLMYGSDTINKRQIIQWAAIWMTVWKQAASRKKPTKKYAIRTLKSLLRYSFSR